MRDPSKGDGTDLVRECDEGGMRHFTTLSAPRMEQTLWIAAMGELRVEELDIRVEANY